MKRRIVGAAAAVILCLFALTGVASAEPTARWQWDGDFTGGYVQSACFADDTHGWACQASGAILATTDGGETWLSQTSGVGTALWDIDFVDGLHGWAVGSGGVILATVDGGTHWSSQLSGLTADIYRLDFVDAFHGWALGNNVLLRTTDGGTTWQASIIDAPAWGAGASTLCFADATQGWLGCGVKLQSTSDGGATWTTHANDYWAGGTIRDITCDDAQNVWLASTGGRVFSSHNGGADWSTAGGPDGALYSVAAADANNLWTISQGGDIFASDDGGETWFKQSSDRPADKLMEGIVIRGSKGWAYGWGFLRTDRNGAGDMRPPSTVVAPQDRFISTTTTYTLTATDDKADSVTTFFRFGWESWQLGTSFVIPAPPDHSGDGAYDVTVSSVDAAGNDEVGNQFTVVVDTVAPSLAVTPETEYMLGYWINQESRVTLHASDPGPSSGVWVGHWFDGTWETMSPDMVWTTPAPKDHTNDGKHVFRLCAIDNCGNVGDDRTLVTWIDTRRPVAKAPYPCTVHKGSYATFKFKIVDAKPCSSVGQVAFVITKLNGRVVKNLAPTNWYKKNTLLGYSFKCRLDKGTYYFWTFVGDGAGNVDKSPARNKLYVK